MRDTDLPAGTNSRFPNSCERSICSVYGSKPSPLYTNTLAEERARTCPGLGSQSCASAPPGISCTTCASSPATPFANS